ncbi:hypothetical protein C0993_005148 [Termitomyces sp. T159_Od127]|nr:hypothetical protein C0993_005148 [Termitomyces sp. T159_Od127]
MPEELRNASDVQEGTSGSVRHELHVSDIIDAVRKRTEACERLVDETVDGLRSYDSFAEGIRDLGCSPDDAKDFFDAVRQRIEIREAKSKAHVIPTREATPEGLAVEELEAFRRERSDTISDLAREQERAHNAAAWAVLRSKLDHIPSPHDRVQSSSQVAGLHKPSEAFYYSPIIAQCGSSPGSTSVSGFCRPSYRKDLGALTGIREGENC